MANVQEFIAAARNDGQKIEYLIKRFYSSMSRRDSFVDGGAHHGFHTMGARQAFSGRVIAVEASPVTYIEHIDRQLAYNGTEKLCESIPINAALGSRAKQGTTVSFHYSPNHPGRSTVNPKLWDAWAKGTVEYSLPITAAVVEIDDLKRLFAADRRVDFIKLDLEGNEINALRGATRVLTHDKPVVVMEYGLNAGTEQIYGETRQEFVQMVRGLGYSLYSPWGSCVDDEIRGMYPFWYVFLLPNGAEEQMFASGLKKAFEESS